MLGQTCRRKRFTPPMYIGEELNRYDQSEEAIIDAFRLISENGTGTLLDYGSGSGVWSLYGSNIFDQVFGIDINDVSLERARSLMEVNKVDNVKFLNLKDLENYDLPALDSVVSVMVIELARSSEVINMFRFIATHLKPGGQFLCVTRRPIGFLRTLLFMERFRWEGFRRGGRRTLASFRSAVEAIIYSKIKSIPRARFYHVPSAIIGLAEHFGLSLRASPRQLASSPTFKQLDLHCSGLWFFNIRTTDWYVFEKCEDDAIHK